MGKISTLDVLRRKGMYLPNICLLCYQNEESVSHTLIHCPFSREVWNVMFQEFGLMWVIPQDVPSLLTSWHTFAINAMG